MSIGHTNATWAARAWQGPPQNPFPQALRPPPAPMRESAHH